ncbi:DUF6479 family protein [Kitasatospora sp. NPDC058201]|uniref:DUF6479 family protein n=1 Tax=unclassified Kitasatospora TaxID=2633591 RepID=UPI0036663BA7
MTTMLTNASAAGPAVSGILLVLVVLAIGGALVGSVLLGVRRQKRRRPPPYTGRASRGPGRHSGRRRPRDGQA